MIEALADSIRSLALDLPGGTGIVRGILEVKGEDTRDHTVSEDASLADLVQTAYDGRHWPIDWLLSVVNTPVILE
jgi:hypothetical protein